MGLKTDLVLVKSTKPENKSSRGAAVIEFALLLPILISLFAAIIEFGFVLYDKAVLTNAAREGARIGVLSRSGSSNKDQHYAAAKTTAAAYCQDRLISLGSDGGGTLDVDASTDSLNSDLLKVTVTYKYSGILLDFLFSSLTGPIELRAEAVMRYE
jgi:Flp pilus assembly protein TadG